MPATDRSTADIAKGALRRLALSQQEPTPENYARAFAEEGGQVAPADGKEAAQRALAELGVQWAQLVDRLARQVDRGSRQWTAARRRESLKRLLDGSRRDPPRLAQRLNGLLSAWENDQPVDASLADVAPAPEAGPAARQDGAALMALEQTIAAALPPRVDDAQEIADALAAAVATLHEPERVAEAVQRIEALCQRARALLGHRHRLLDSLLELCHELGAGLADLVEDDRWSQGQCALLREHLGTEGDAAEPSVRSVQAARHVLAETRQHQQRIKADRAASREALQQLIQGMLTEVGALGDSTGRFHQATARHAESIAQAETLDSLAGVVRELLADTRDVQAAVSASQGRLQADAAQVQVLEAKVQALEAELRQLSSEVSTDVLTQVANRRGLIQAFDTELARMARELEAGGEPRLAVGLIDIDNFKKLNDSLGHAAGDQALKRLAAEVRQRLRPQDHLARFGGEEFVVLLPDTSVEEAQKALTRLQRSLTEALFLHEGREVFVTFSAGVSAWREGEALEAAMERADQGLYEAKRTGKNRTCAV